MRNIQLTRRHVRAAAIRSSSASPSPLRYPDAQPGKKIMFGKSPWDVVGIFHAADQAANSEVWCDFNQLAGDYERPGGSSSLLIRLENPADFAPSRRPSKMTSASASTSSRKRTITRA